VDFLLFQSTMYSKVPPLHGLSGKKKTVNGTSMRGTIFGRFGRWKR